MTTEPRNIYTNQVVGPRAAVTRETLLDALTELLTAHPVRHIKVNDVTRIAKVSPATFWHYFRTLDDAVVALVNRVEAAAMAKFPPNSTWYRPSELSGLLYQFAVDHAVVLSAALGIFLDHPSPELSEALEGMLDPLVDATLSLGAAGPEETRSVLWLFLVSMSASRSLPPRRFALGVDLAVIALQNYLARLEG